ncbi:unnamed protein product [Ectocarpus sp. 6 AP-2014]
MINLTWRQEEGYTLKFRENETLPRLGADRRFLSAATNYRRTRFFVSVSGVTLSTWASTWLFLLSQFVTSRQSVALYPTTVVVFTTKKCFPVFPQLSWTPSVIVTSQLPKPPRRKCSTDTKKQSRHVIGIHFYRTVMPGDAAHTCWRKASFHTPKPAACDQAHTRGSLEWKPLGRCYLPPRPGTVTLSQRPQYCTSWQHCFHMVHEYLRIRLFYQVPLNHGSTTPLETVILLHLIQGLCTLEVLT